MVQEHARSVSVDTKLDDVQEARTMRRGFSLRIFRWFLHSTNGLQAERTP